jgi:hypothetical protein
MNDPKEILRKIRRLELRTRRLVESSFAGQYQSVFKGRGMNFEEVREYAPGDEFVVEWRALTVALLDKIGDAVRKSLGKTADELPLAKVLQGGTWAAGRKVAAKLRADGGSPVKLKSDGTVF